MRTTRIPRLEQPVSVVGFGCWALSGPAVWTSGSDAAGIAAVRPAIVLGINFFDVAPVYGLGHAEEVLGRALGTDREDVIIASKCGLVWDQSGTVTNNLTGPSLRQEIDASLERLQTDYIDVYQMHWPDPATPVEESMDALLAIQASGKIRHIGVSNFSVAETRQALEVGPLATYQGLMNILELNAESYHGIPLEYRAFDEVFPVVNECDMAFLPYSPIMQGLLSDSYDPAKVGPGDVRRENPNLFGPDAHKYADAAARLRSLSRELGRPLEQVAVNWLAAQPGMGPVIAGAETAAQVEETAAAGAWELTAAQLEAVSRAAT